MAIGILALAFGAVLLPVSLLGAADNRPPERKNRAVRYPYPKEL